jgi:TetR/AcrR family transcriptional regulator, tetracycline repressor protein
VAAGAAPVIRRGRPPRTSRERIIDKAVELLQQEPDQPLSMHALARALELSPMALYGHVQDKDSLLQAVAARLLGELKPRIPEGSWQQQLRAWALATRRHFLRYPMLPGLLGWRGHIAAAWLAQLALLARMLARAGFEGEALADAMQWSSAMVVGAISMEISGRRDGVRLNRSDLAALQPADAEMLATLLPHLLKKRAAASFSAHIDYLVDALEARSRVLMAVDAKR